MIVKRIFLIFCYCCCIICALFSQQTYITFATLGKKEQGTFQKAKSLAAAGSYDKSEKLLLQLQKNYPTFVDGWLLLGKIKYDLDDYTAAQNAFLKVIQLNPDFNTEVYYMLGVTEWKLDQFEAAAKHFEVFLQKKPKSERLQAQGQRYFENATFASQAVKHPVPFVPKPLSGEINTAAPEYLPSLSADQQKLIFTRYVQGQEDFYISTKINGIWQLAEPLTSINTPLNEGAQTISADEKTMVFGAGDRPDGLGGYDLYVAEYKNKAFASPINMGANVNTKARERQPTLSGDGKTLYFETNRSDGIGGTDIWVSYKLPNGTWAKAQNIGPPINTPYDESAPFLHQDGQTLYFMSNGHPGMGDFDLYFAQKQEDGTWGEPKNLGYPINTKAAEGALIVSLDGKKGYFTSDQTQGNGTDIFEFDLPAQVQPKAVTYVRATIKDAKTKKILPYASIIFTNLTDHSNTIQTNADEAGTFLTVLPLDTKFGLNVTHPGYLFHSEHFALSDAYASQSPYELELFLQPIPTPSTDQTTIEPIVLKNLFFQVGTATVLEQSLSELERLKNLLETQTQLRIEIHGHTDDVGDALSNQQLSEARAKAVYDYLVERGISQNRLAYKGFGETQPIATNDTPIGRQQNRRTAFVVVTR